MTSPSSPATSRARRALARWLLAASIFGAAMALGAVHTVVLVIVTVALAACAGLAWWGAEPIRVRSAASILFWVGVALTGITLAQIVPMPAQWLSKIAPANADVWAGCLRSLRLPGPAWITVSLDPTATRVQVLRGVAYLLAFVAAVRVARSRRGVTFLEWAVVATGLALAVAAWVHPAIGAERVFGVYKPHYGPGTRHLAPLINANVLSGYLNLAICILFAWALAPRGPVPRVLAVAFVAFLVATQVWVASRGGMLAMAVGMVVVVAMMAGARREGDRLPLAVIGGVFLLAAGSGAAVLALSESSRAELITTETEKLDIARHGLGMIAAFPWLGAGRGAFESVFPAFQGGDWYVVYTHPENFVVQWASEWGAIVAAVAFTGIGVALRPSTVLARSYVAVGAWGGLTSVGIHDLVNFGSEFPGVMIAIVVCAAIVVGGTAGSGAWPRLGGWARRPRALAVAGIAVAVLGVLGVLPGIGHELADDRVALRAMAAEESVSRENFHEAARSAMLRHPAEPYLSFAGAERAWRTKDGGVIPWLERTFERARVYGPAHLLLARALREAAPGQALLEYRMALEQSPELSFFAEILPLLHRYEDAVEVLPDGRRAIYLDELARRLRPKLPGTAARLNAQEIAEDPAQTLALARAAGDALDDVTGGSAASWCDDVRREQCLVAALDAAMKVEAADPTHCAGFSLHAQGLIEAGRTGEAITELAGAAERVGDRTECLEELVRVAQRTKSEAAETRALELLSRASCAKPVDCVATLRFVASTELSRGNRRIALSTLEKAHQRAPEDEGVLGDIATLASKTGAHGEAVRAYEELLRRHPAEAERWTSAIEAERGRAAMDSVEH